MGESSMSKRWKIVIHLGFGFKLSLQVKQTDKKKINPPISAWVAEKRARMLQSWDYSSPAWGWRSWMKYIFCYFFNCGFHCILFRRLYFGKFHTVKKLTQWSMLSVLPFPTLTPLISAQHFSLPASCLFVNNRLCLVKTVHMLMGVGISTGAWKIRHGPYPQ